MDRSAIDELQMHGQDIPWLLAHWADPQARPSGAGLGSARRRRPAAGPTPSCSTPPTGLAAGLSRPWHRPGRQGAHPRRELPRDAPRLAGLRDGRRGRRHHQHPLGGRRDRLLRRAHRLCRGHHRSPTYCRLGRPRPAPTSQWVAVIPDGDDPGRRRPGDASALERITFAVAVRRRPARGRAGRSSRCCRSASCSRRARPAGPRRWCTPTPTRCGPAAIGPRNIDLGTDDRYLIYLPLFHVNAQSWSMFSVLGVGATAVLMPKWSSSRFWDVVTRHEITHISLMPFCIATIVGSRSPGHDHAAHRGVRAHHAGARLDARASTSTPPTA